MSRRRKPLSRAGSIPRLESFQLVKYFWPCYLLQSTFVWLPRLSSGDPSLLCIGKWLKDEQCIIQELEYEGLWKYCLFTKYRNKKGSLDYCLSSSLLSSSLPLSYSFPFFPVTDHNSELNYMFFVIWMYFLIKVLGKSLYSFNQKVNKWILKVRYF